jgi:hypothetical protein
VNAAQRLGKALADERRRGAPFEAIWDRCVERAVAGEGRASARHWRTAFGGTEGAWWASYRRSGPSSPVAMLALPSDEPRDPVDARAA